MAKQLTTDEEFKLQRQARRRLIGAVALTTALVVILPMVFDREPVANLSNEIELRIPDKDKVAELLPASAVVISSAVSMATPVASSNVVAHSGVEMAAVSQVMPVSVVVHAEKVPVNAKSSHEKTPAPQVELSPFALQVGAYSSMEKANAVVEKLAKQGLHAYADQGAENVRVRISGFKSREAAEKVRHTLEKSGYHPNVLQLSN